MTILTIFLSVIVVSLISLLGVIYLALSESKIEKIMLWFVSFAAGTLLGDVFLHLLPEIVNRTDFSLTASLTILVGIFVFFAMEKFIFWHHCHNPSHHHPKPLAAMNLIGDAMHNFLDGMIVAGSYFISPSVGLATTIAVVLHEIPQEISDFGILIHAGLSKIKAIIFNLASAMTALLGAAVAIWLKALTNEISSILIALTIGAFIYIATADLIPELKKETKVIDSFKQLFGISIGIGIMVLLLLLE